MSPAAALRAVKIAHTVVWALFASSILALPYFSWRQGFALVAAEYVGKV
jgi:hypothetical protein